MTTQVELQCLLDLIFACFIWMVTRARARLGRTIVFATFFSECVH